jgi:hypothetical protein
VDRFQAGRQALTDFLDEIWVHCPQCGKQAQVRQLKPGSVDVFAPRRCSCLHCGVTQDWSQGTVTHAAHAAVDPYFQYRLWLQVPCCGQVLWAYNPQHLDFLSAFVGATLRERRVRPRLGWSNRSLASRLPKWMQAKHNRQKVVSAIEQLRNSL